MNLQSKSKKEQILSAVAKMVLNREQRINGATIADKLNNVSHTYVYKVLKQLSKD